MTTAPGDKRRQNPSDTRHAASELVPDGRVAPSMLLLLTNQVTRPHHRVTTHPDRSPGGWTTHDALRMRDLLDHAESVGPSTAGAGR